MLSSLGRFTTRYFLIILIIFIYIVIDSFLGVSALHAGIIAYLPRDSLIDFRILAFNIVLLALSSPPLLTLLLLRRPSFLRLLLHVASALYTLVALPLILKYTSPLMLVVSSAALVAGLPEAMAAGRWARLVYYAGLLLWLYLFNLAYFAEPLF
jgi:hypothetical protein